MKANDKTVITRTIEVHDQDLRAWLKDKNLIPDDWKFFSVKPEVGAIGLTIVMQIETSSQPKP